MNLICVYKVTNPKGKVYIGSTIDYKRRLVNYETLVCKNQKKLYNSLLKYGFDKHVFEVLCYCDKSDLRQKESYYGHLYNCLGEHVSEATKEKLRAAAKQQWINKKSRLLQTGLPKN